MLEKTIALLDGIPPGTHLPDDRPCHDPDELDALGRVLDRLLYSPASLRRVLQERFGVTLARADKYGELPTVAEIERSFASPSLLRLDAVFPDNDTMLAELDRLAEVSHEFDPPRTGGAAGEYVWENGAFSYSDPVAYYAMIRTRRPRTIVEIGGGWHSRVARMACARNGFGRIVTIEPDDEGAALVPPEAELVRRPVREVETGFFNALLRDGDMLFIDSSHAVRHDGDCLHIWLRIVPGLEAAVAVHAHDIFLPGTLASEMMLDQQIFWNEQYLLFAYLIGNPRARVLFGSRYHEWRNRARLELLTKERYAPGGGSFWFAQSKPIGSEPYTPGTR